MLSLKNLKNALSNNTNDAPVRYQYDLHYAVQSNDLKKVKVLLLLDQTSNKVNEIDKEDYTPLQLATEMGYSRIVEALIKAGADVELKTKYNDAPICIAARNNYSDIMLLLINSGANVNVRDSWDYPIHHMVDHNNIEMLKILIKSGADVNSIEREDDQTPLHRACETGNIIAATILLESGANPFLLDSNTNTALDVAVEEKHNDIILLLKKIDVTKIKPKYILHDAVKSCSFYTIGKLLENGYKISSKINEMDESALTPLHHAVYVNSPGAAIQLAEAGADVNFPYQASQTPLYLAAERGYTLIINILIEHQANVDLRAQDGSAPIHIAAQNNHPDSLNALIKGHADINSKTTGKGRTALIIGVSKGHLEIVRVLVEAKANVNLSMKDQTTALYIAAEFGHLEIAKILVNAGADLKQKKSGKSARDIAIEKNHSDIVELIDSLNHEILFSDLTKENRIGKGSSGKVYLGKYNGHSVAIKEPNADITTPGIIDELKKEAQIIAQLNSPYVIKLLGICFHDNEISLVMEYASNGSLYEFYRKQDLAWPTRIKISIDMAQGLKYLHENNIIHRDVKSPNVLIMQDNSAKLGDFGLAKIMNSLTQTNSLSPKGTLRWIAPEIIKSDNPKYNSKTDMYALGVTLFEVAERKLPFQGVDGQIASFRAIKGDRDNVDSHYFTSLIKRCWAERQEDRPTSSEVVAQLEAIKVECQNDANNNASKRFEDLISGITINSLKK